MASALQQIIRYNAGRDPERLALKYEALRSGVFPFLRGTCHLFYARFADESSMRKAPAAWSCGDLHLENFGSYKGDNRLVYFDINDFDEALLAPATWDVLRFLTSALVAAESLHITEQQALGLCDRYLSAYCHSLAFGKARWIERETAPEPIAVLLNAVRERDRPTFLDKRTELKGKRRRIRIDGRKALAASDAEKSMVKDFLADFAKSQPHPEFFEVIDVARRIAGTGSLGLARYIVLVQGKGSPHANYLLDLKRAQPSSLAQHVSTKQPAWGDEAQRIVSIQRRMQAISMAFLHPVQLDGEPWVLRALLPSEDRLSLAVHGHDGGALESVVAAMGDCTAWAQLRSAGRDGSATADELIAFAARKKWRTDVMDLARAAAKQTRRDWQRFCEAFDDGALGDAGGKP